MQNALIERGDLGAFVWDVVSDSMAPTLRSGDRVLVGPADTDPTFAGIVLADDGAGPFLARLERRLGSNPPQASLAYDNPLHGAHVVSLDRLSILGRVKWVVRSI